MFNTSLLAKGVGVLLVGGGIVGAGTAYALNSGTQEPQKIISIKEKLSNEGKKLLEGEDQELWGIKLATYQRITKTDQTFKLSEATNGSLKIWCTTNIEQEDNETNQKLYARIKEVCTVPSNKEKLLKDAKELASETSDWTNRTSAYRLEATDSPIEGIVKTTIKENDLRDWCTKELGQEYKKEGNKETLYVKWCTKAGT